MGCKGEPGKSPTPRDRFLDAIPKAHAGFSPAWVRKLPKGKKRGYGFKGERDFWKLPRLVNRFWTATERTPDFERRLSYAVADFARGADKDEAGYIAKKPFFTEKSENVSAADVKRACLDDDAFYRLMINPYDGERVVSREFVRTFMRRVEETIGARLLWTAVIHAKGTSVRENNRHVHILIRSRTFGDEVIQFTRTFAFYGFQHIAAELIAKRIGPMTAAELTQAKTTALELECNRERKELEQAGAPEWAILPVLEDLRLRRGSELGLLPKLVDGRLPRESSTFHW